MKELIAKLEKIQTKMNAPKSQRNKFGNYDYRNCEDILQAVKPYLDGCVITITDSIEAVGNRIYVKATATITDGEHSISTNAFAREAESRKGMDDSQLTGSTSSYARKYALGGLLLIDDNKDADSAAPVDDSKPTFVIDDNARGWIKAINAGTANLEQIDDQNYRKFIEDNLNA